MNMINNQGSDPLSDFDELARDAAPALDPITLLPAADGRQTGQPDPVEARMGDLSERVQRAEARSERMMETLMRQQNSQQAPAPVEPEPVMEIDPDVQALFDYLTKQQQGEIGGRLDRIEEGMNGVLQMQSEAVVKDQIPGWDQWKPQFQQRLKTIHEQDPALAQALDTPLGARLLYENDVARSGGAPQPQPQPQPTGDVMPQPPGMPRGHVEGFGGGPTAVQNPALRVTTMSDDDFDQYMAALEGGAQLPYQEPDSFLDGGM